MRAAGLVAVLVAVVAIIVAMAGHANALTCTQESRTQPVMEFWVIYIPGGFGGSATDLRVYDGSEWISAQNITQNGYNVTGFFRIYRNTLTITRVGIYHTSGGYNDPTHVIIKLVNGTVLLDTNVNSHTWVGGTSYFEYVDIPSTTVTASSSEEYTEYTCNVDASVAESSGNRAAYAKPATLRLGVGGGIESGSTGETTTITVTQARTYTITKTVTQPNGETTTVVTEVRTVTMPQQGPRKAVLVGLGLVALMLLLLARR